MPTFECPECGTIFEHPEMPPPSCPGCGFSSDEVVDSQGDEVIDRAPPEDSPADEDVGTSKVEAEPTSSSEASPLITSSSLAARTWGSAFALAGGALIGIGVILLLALIRAAQAAAQFESSFGGGGGFGGGSGSGGRFLLMLILLFAWGSILVVLGWRSNRLGKAISERRDWTRSARIVGLLFAGYVGFAAIVGASFTTMTQTVTALLFAGSVGAGSVLYTMDDPQAKRAGGIAFAMASAFLAIAAWILSGASINPGPTTAQSLYGEGIAASLPAPGILEILDHLAVIAVLLLGGSGLAWAWVDDAEPRTGLEITACIGAVLYGLNLTGYGVALSTFFARNFAELARAGELLRLIGLPPQLFHVIIGLELGAFVAQAAAGVVVGAAAMLAIKPRFDAVTSTTRAAVR